MKRIIYIDGDYYYKEKYVLKEEYEGFGIYQHLCPSGFFTHQQYLISNGETTVLFPSFNRICKEELLDAIDNFNESGKFGIKCYKTINGYLMHPSGDITV